MTTFLLSQTFGWHPMVYGIKQTPEKYKLVLAMFVDVPTLFHYSRTYALDTLGTPSFSLLDIACSVFLSGSCCPSP